MYTHPQKITLTRYIASLRQHSYPRSSFLVQSFATPFIMTGKNSRAICAALTFCSIAATSIIPMQLLLSSETCCTCSTSFPEKSKDYNASLLILVGSSWKPVALQHIFSLHLISGSQDSSTWACLKHQWDCP